MSTDGVFPFSQNDVEEHKKSLRQQTESTAELITRLLNFSEKEYKNRKSLENDLEEKTEMLQKTEEHLAEVQKQFEEWRDKSTEFSEKLSQLGHKYEEKTEMLQKTEEHLADVQKQFEEWRDKSTELSEKLSQLGHKYDETVEEQKRALATRNEEIEKLHQAVIDAEDMNVGVKYLKRNVDAFRLGQNFLQEPRAACMLPDGRVVVADTIKGLVLYSSNSELRKHVESDEWKWPQCLVYDEQEKRIIVSLLRKTSKDRYRRALAFFSLNLEPLEFLDGPGDETGLDNAAVESLAYNFKAGAYFLSVADRGDSIVYKLPVKTTKWIPLISRPGAVFTDVQVLSHHNSITEILVIETRMGYVHKFAINDADILYRKSLATVEKPSAICVDDVGALFVHDSASGKIFELNTNSFDPKRQIGLVDDMVVSMTASHGYMGVALRQGKIVQIFRYQSDASALAAEEA